MGNELKNLSTKVSKRIIASIMAAMVVIMCFSIELSVEAKTQTKSKAKIEAPQITDKYIDGEYVYFTWTKVSSAKSYNVYYEGSKYNFTINQSHIKIADRDKTYSIKVSAVSSDGTESDKVSASLYVPEIDYSEIDHIQASCLSLNQLKEWAEYNGYEYSVDDLEKESMKVLCISEKDESNRTWDVLKKGFADGVTDYGKSKVEDIENADIGDYISKGQDILNEYDETGSVGGVVKEEAKKFGWEAALSGAKSAVINWGSKYNYKYTNIQYQYYYDINNLDHRTKQAACLFLQTDNNNSYVQSMKDKYIYEDEEYCIIKSYDGTWDIKVWYEQNNTDSSYPRWTEHIQLCTPN